MLAKTNTSAGLPYVEFQRGLIENMLKDVKNIKGNLDELNKQCIKINNSTSDVKLHYYEVLKEIKNLFKGECKKVDKLAREETGRDDFVQEGLKRQPHEFKVGDRVVILNNYKLDHQFKTALVTKISSQRVYVVLDHLKETTARAFKNVCLAKA